MAATPQQQGKYFKGLAVLAARTAEEKKGENILLLHIRPVSTIADYLLIVSATSPAHIRAIEEAVRVRLKTDGENPGRRDGRQSDIWRVLDYGGLLVHLMHPKARDFYSLDKLFHNARPVEWLVPPKKSAPQKSVPKKAAKKKKSKTVRKTKAVRRRAHD
ncbi:ribosome silencing factor [Patescibacteria group bacterium]|nr:ribosome silencing factor [Patescibacteria group bacterium]